MLCKIYAQHLLAGLHHFLGHVFGLWIGVEGNRNTSHLDCAVADHLSTPCDITLGIEQPRLFNLSIPALQHVYIP